MFSVRNRTVLVCLIAIATATTAGFAQGGPGRRQGGRKPGGEQITSIEERTSGLKKIDGFFPLYLDEGARPACGSRSPSSTPKCSTRRGSPRASGRTTSASIAAS